jgi:hypothetical protein
MPVNKSSIPISSEYRIHLNFLKLKLGCTDYESLIKMIEKMANIRSN